MVVLAVTAAFAVAAQDADADEVVNQVFKGRPVGYIYLVDLITIPNDGSDSSNDSYVPEERKDGGVALANPIPEDQSLPDGVYFKPEDGKPVDKSEVNISVWAV